MYREDEFYYITDKLYFDVYNVALKEHLKSQERLIVKIFRKDDEEVVIETLNGVNTIIKDTRKDKNSDIYEFDLVFVKVLERYTSDYEIKGMTYESVEGIGSWCRVKIDGYHPNDKILKPFYLKKKITKEDLKKYAKTKEELTYLEKFYDITKGHFKFTKVSDVKKIFTNTTM